MSDFAKFCPKCYTFFRDPDLFAKHVEACGFAKDKKNAGRETVAEKKTTGKSSQEPEVRIQKESASRKKQVEVENESSDSDIPTPDSLPKSPKFKT